MKHLIIYLSFITLFFTGCSTDPESDNYAFPTTISGQVLGTGGVALDNAKVTLESDKTIFVFTDSKGFFRLDNVAKQKHNVIIERIGYAAATVAVPSAVNNISTVVATLIKSNIIAPTEKPVSKGMVRINKKVLEVDFERDGTYTPFVIKGVAYSVASITTANFSYTKQTDRAFQWLVPLNANTIRTYSGVDLHTLNVAAASNIRVIVSFWVDYAANLSDPAVRKKMIDDFSKLVLTYKDHPGVLMWNLGNEQNYQNGNNANWYSLCQEMAKAAYEIEGENYHPVSINNGNTFNIGNASFKADDNTLTYIDLWAMNAYDPTMTNVLNRYSSLSNKPCVITEFGIDALNHNTKLEYEKTQADFDSTNWVQIRTKSDFCVGATVFEFTDEWWKAENPTSHDFGGYATGAHPDGYSNEEWWGIIAISPDATNDGLDEWRPRLAYYMFQRLWK